MMIDPSLAWIPRFDYGEASLSLTLPITRWNPGARTEGRVLASATNVLGPSLRLRKYLLSFALRFTEEEWPSVIPFMAWAQSGASFLWVPQGHDAAQPASLEVVLEAPRLTTNVAPVRDANLIWLMTLPITVARMSAPWDLEYFRIPLEA